MMFKLFREQHFIIISSPSVVKIPRLKTWSWNRSWNG